MGSKIVHLIYNLHTGRRRAELGDLNGMECS